MKDSGERLPHPGSLKSTVTLAEKIKFYSDLDQETGCWNWRRYVLPNGYGKVAVGSKGVHKLAHRAAYECFVGPIPPGLQIDHLCRNRRCVNPAHLEAVTARENTLRSNATSAINARKTHCLRGHPFATASEPLGERVCVSCRRARYKPSAWRHSTSKLTPENVGDIRAARAAGATFTSIGNAYGVSEGTIRNIWTGRSWKEEPAR